VEQELATPIESQDLLKAFTLKEIKDEIKMLNQKKAPYYCQNDKKNYENKDL